MSIWDFPVKFVYGYSAAYGPDFHTGEDRTAPVGTEVTVNGVTVGLSGNTGKSTGPHCHIGRWVGGSSTNPNGGGAIVAGAKVTQIDTVGDTNNGKFVRVQDADGSSWVYLHLSKVLVNVGEELKGEDEPMFNDGDRVNVNKFLYGEDRGEHQDAIGQPWKEAIYAILKSDYFAQESRVNQGDIENMAVFGFKPQGAKGKVWKTAVYEDVVPNIKPTGFKPLGQDVFVKE